MNYIDGEIITAKRDTRDKDSWGGIVIREVAGGQCSVALSHKVA
jgi:hypothetical protein